MGRAARATSLLALTGAGTLAYAWGWERDAFTLRAVGVALLPPGAPALRVLHLSDLHLRPDASRHTDRLVAWVRDLAVLAPDLVVATGDFLAAADAVPTVVDALDPLLDRPGVFVPGNADYWAPVPKSPTRYVTRSRKHGGALPWPDLATALTARGWTDLTHRRTQLAVSGLDIEIRGVDDPYLGKDDYALVAGAADPAADLRLGLAHAPEPRVLDGMTRDGVDLLLAGHTHGGQVRLPGLGALVTNCGIDRARARGLSRYGAGGRVAALHVSAGLGTSPYAPVRLACRPEATLLTVTARPPGAAEPDPRHQRPATPPR